MDLIERLRERRITRWVHSTGMPPKSDGFTRDALCIEAADEIERLTNNTDNLRQQVEDLTKERDALRLDAARYRWLRANHLQVGPDAWIITGDDLDEAIDAAMKERR